MSHFTNRNIDIDLQDVTPVDINIKKNGCEVILHNHSHILYKVLFPF